MRELSARKQKILAAVVEQYIATGEPVGSKALCDKLGVSVSSATIRNEMAELAEMGYLIQPHTSAGRIPSEQGYRYYVDQLMPRIGLSQGEKSKITAMLTLQGNDPNHVLQHAGAVLAALTGCAAIATSATGRAAIIRRIEVVPISAHSALLILLTSTGILKNRICRAQGEMTPEVRRIFAQVAREHFLDQPLSAVDTVTIQGLAASLLSFPFAVTELLITLGELMRDAVEADILLDGRENLLFHREFETMFRELFQLLANRERLERMLVRQDQGLRVTIGSENPYKELSHSSVIVARYQLLGQDAGSLGIIGPTRMDYARMIASLEYLAQMVGDVLSGVLELE